MRTIILIAVIFFAYQTPNLAKLAGSSRFARERLQDTLLGLFLGAVNGYLIFGIDLVLVGCCRVSHFRTSSKPQQVKQPWRSSTCFPLTGLDTPMIYFAVAIAFAFVLVVFI